MRFGVFRRQLGWSLKSSTAVSTDVPTSSDLFILRSYGGDWGIERLCVFRAVCEARRLESTKELFPAGSGHSVRDFSKFRGGSEPI
jgi:hypothetical protein